MTIGEYRQRFEFALLVDESEEEFAKPETAWELIARAHQLGPDDIRFIRQIVYTFESRVAQQWRADRVFLVGDAAHTMPPYLGQGACSGIRDSLNLAWKLDLVLRGLSDDTLLDSYEVERRPHTSVITQMAMGLGAIANTHDHAAADQRDAAFMSGQAPPPPSMPTLDDGVIREPSAGGLVPQGRVTFDGRTGRLDDVVGHGFALITDIDVTAMLSDSQQQFLAELGCPILQLGRTLLDEDGVHTAYLLELGAVAYLARPDFILFGSASSADDVAELVDDLRSSLAWSAVSSAVRE